MAACPGTYSGADCVDSLGANICSLTGSTYSCDPAVGSSSVGLLALVGSDSAAGTYDVYGTDSDNARFCCSVPHSGVYFITVTGAAGSDVLAGDSSLCGLSGGGTELTLSLFGAEGPDNIAGSSVAGCSSLYEHLHGGADADSVMCGGRTVHAYGDGGSIWTGDWLIDGADGADPNAMQCTLHGGPGNDHLETINELGTIMLGGAGDDWLEGDIGPDVMHGGEGDDVMSGSAGDDKMWGDAGSDILAGRGDKDELYGGEGADVICGGDGDDDEMYGGEGNDKLDDDWSGGTSFGQGGFDICDSLGGPVGCESTPVLPYQCGAY